MNNHQVSGIGSPLPGRKPASPLPGRKSASGEKRSPLSEPKKKHRSPSENGMSEPVGKPSGPPCQTSMTGERTVKRLRLSKALTIPEGTTVLDACRRMATRRVDAALLTDSNALLCGIITDKDIATRVIAEGLKPAEVFVSKVMTRNPVFVMSDTLAVEALQKMVQGKFRHLPVVENGEVIALLDITKCLYDAIARMERAAEKGNAIAAAVEGVERQWGSPISGQSSFIDTLRERMFRPSLATIVTENKKVLTISPIESVFMATKKMRELHLNAAVVTIENKPRGILTSKDVLMRVVSQNLSPESTLVEKVMTPNPECVTSDTTIVDALHVMHDGKFLHLPVVDKDGFVVACIDVLQITHAAVAMVGSTGPVGNDMSNTMMQKFWDSALALDPVEYDNDSQSDVSLRMLSETTETGKSMYSSLGLGNSFTFKLVDRKGRVHRFHCGTESLTELISAIIQRAGDDIDQFHLPQILYEDDEGDKVLLATDSDLVAAVNYARLVGLKGLRIHLDYSNLEGTQEKKKNQIKQSEFSGDLQLADKDRWGSAYATVAAGAALVAGLGVMAYVKRSNF
uniref:CBS domain-containing protein n=1 Tax=Araucaria cunninghamii TaxID=56994 RepID=A0A0D6R4R6_ARACU